MLSCCFPGSIFLSFFFFLCIADMCLQPKIGIMPFSMNMFFFFFSPFPSLYYVHSLKKKKKSIFCNFEFDEIKWFLSDFLSFFFFPFLFLLSSCWVFCERGRAAKDVPKLAWVSWCFLRSPLPSSTTTVKQTPSRFFFLEFICSSFSCSSEMKKRSESKKLCVVRNVMEEKCAE